MFSLRPAKSDYLPSRRPTPPFGQYCLLTEADVYDCSELLPDSQTHWLQIIRSNHFATKPHFCHNTHTLWHCAVKCLRTWLMISISSPKPKATDDPFGLPLITCANMCTHNSFGDRSFGAAGPRIWNSLPCGREHWKSATNILKCYWRQTPCPEKTAPLNMSK